MIWHFPHAHKGIWVGNHLLVRSCRSRPWKSCPINRCHILNLNLMVQYSIFEWYLINFEVSGSLCSCVLPNVQQNVVQDEWRHSSLSTLIIPRSIRWSSKASIPIIAAFSAKFNFFRKFWKTFLSRWSEMCMLWNSIFDPSDLDFLTTLQFPGAGWVWRFISPSQFPEAGRLSVGFNWCFASVSCHWMKHNSDPIFDSPGCSNHPNLLEDLSWHLRGSLTLKFVGLGFATAEPSSAVLS